MISWHHPFIASFLILRLSYPSFIHLLIYHSSLPLLSYCANPFQASKLYISRKFDIFSPYSRWARYIPPVGKEFPDIPNLTCLYMMHKSAYLYVLCIRIRMNPHWYCGQLDPVPDPKGQNVPQKYKSEEIACSEVLDVILGELKASLVARTSFMEAWD